MPPPAPAKPGSPPTRESTPAWNTRHAAQQRAKTDAASLSALLEGLYAKSLVSTGEQATVENLANALLLMLKQKEYTKNTSLQVTLKAIAVLLKVAADPFENIRKSLDNAVESRVGTAMVRLEENVSKLTEELLEFKDEYSKTSTELVEKVGEVSGGVQSRSGDPVAGAGGVAHEEGPGGGDAGRAYAAAVGGLLERPAQVVTSRIDKQDQQILLDCESVEGEGAGISLLPESALVLKAQLALEGLSEDLHETMPEGAKFRSANVLQNGGVVYELNSKEAADWIKRPDICAAFADNFGSTVKYKEHSFPVVVECAPISFDTSTRQSFGRFEHDNNLPANSISSGRYIRPPAMRTKNQRHGHIVLQFCTKEAANACIKSPVVIEGKQTDARKLAKKPVRCTKCQKYGHSTKKCKSPTFECGTCLGQHNTKDCPNRNNRYCKTCGITGHPTWDTKCPGYYAECALFGTRVPDNLYRFYLMSEEWTWEKVTDTKPSITAPPPFQPTAAAFTQPPPPRMPRAPRPPPFGRFVRNTTPIANPNLIPITNSTSRLAPVAMTVNPNAPLSWADEPVELDSWGFQPTSATTPATTPAPNPARWTPSAPNVPLPPHPRPDNVAGPSTGGITIKPRAARGRGSVRAEGKPASPARSQSQLTNYFTPRRDSISSAFSTPGTPVVDNV